MQQHIKYLVVEDTPAWSRAISATVHSYFEEERGLHRTRIKGLSAYDGDQGSEQLSHHSFDLVTLDMNLGEGASRSKISGLDLLGEIAANNRAFFVIIITAAVHDPDLERLFGKEAAARMRYEAMNEAIRQLPAERVRILHKPQHPDDDIAAQVLRPHLRSALDQYCAVSRERNIFRPFPCSDLLWEVRYNGGPRLTIPASETFELIRSALAQPNREMKVIQLIQAIAHSSGKAGAVELPEAPEEPPRREAKDESGLDWEETEHMSTPDHAPVDTIEGTITLEVLIGALLLAKRRGLRLEEIVRQFVDAYGTGPVLSLRGKIKEYIARPGRAAEEFQIENAGSTLQKLRDDLAPLIRELRAAAAVGEPAKPSKTKAKPRVALGRDTSEMQLARAHWKRARRYLARYPILDDFVRHIEQSVERGLTAKGHIHYAPTHGSEFCPFWLTS